MSLHTHAGTTLPSHFNAPTEYFKQTDDTAQFHYTWRTEKESQVITATPRRRGRICPVHRHIWVLVSRLTAIIDVISIRLSHGARIIYTGEREFSIITIYVPYRRHSLSSFWCLLRTVTIVYYYLAQMLWVGEAIYSVVIECYFSSLAHIINIILSKNSHRVIITAHDRKFT